MHNGNTATRPGTGYQGRHRIALGPSELEVQTGANNWQTATVLPHSFVHPWLTVLALSEDRTHKSSYAVLIPGRLGSEDFRRLRTYLVWGRVQAADSA